MNNTLTANDSLLDDNSRKTGKGCTMREKTNRLRASGRPGVLEYGARCSQRNEPVDFRLKSFRVKRLHDEALRPRLDFRSLAQRLAGDQQDRHIGIMRVAKRQQVPAVANRHPKIADDQGRKPRAEVCSRISLESSTTKTSGTYDSRSVSIVWALPCNPVGRKLMPTRSLLSCHHDRVL